MGLFLEDSVLCPCVFLYKGDLCKKPFITPLKWALGEKRFHSNPLDITIMHGPELKSVRETLVLLILNGLNSAPPCLISTNHPKTPLTFCPAVVLLYPSLLYPMLCIFVMYLPL